MDYEEIFYSILSSIHLSKSLPSCWYFNKYSTIRPYQEYLKVNWRICWMHGHSVLENYRDRIRGYLCWLFRLFKLGTKGLWVFTSFRCTTSCGQQCDQIKCWTLRKYTFMIHNKHCLNWQLNRSPVPAVLQFFFFYSEFVFTYVRIHAHKQAKCDINRILKIIQTILLLSLLDTFSAFHNVAIL